MTFFILFINTDSKYSPISTNKNFLSPLSSLFKFITACPVVPEPAKKSKVDEFLSVRVISSIFSISATGFGVSNILLPKTAFTSFVDLLFIYSLLSNILFRGILFFS
jgi:hypothetical protein